MAGFFVLASVMFLVFLGGGATIAVFPLYARSLGATLVEVSWIAGAYATVGLIANLAWGRASDRLGRRKPLLVAAMGTMAATNLAASVAGGWWVLLVVRMVDGVAFGAYAVASLAMLGDILADHPRRARLVGGARMAGSLAFAIAVTFAGLVSQGFGLPAAYRAAAAIYLLAFLASLLLPERRISVARSEAVPTASFAELVRGPMLPLLALVASFSIPFSAVYYAMWPIWISTDLGLGAATASQLWGLAAFVEVPSLAVAGYLTDRFGRRFTFTLGMVVFAGVYALYLGTAAVSGAVATLLPPSVGASAEAPSMLPVLIFAQLLRGFGFAAFTATALTTAIEVSPPESRGRAAGLYSMAESLSSIAGSYIGGPIVQALGYPSLFAGAGCAVLFGAGYVRLALGHPRKGQPAVVGGRADEE